MVKIAYSTEPVPTDPMAIKKRIPIYYWVGTIGGNTKVP